MFTLGHMERSRIKLPDPKESYTRKTMWSQRSGSWEPYVLHTLVLMKAKICHVHSREQIEAYRTRGSWSWREEAGREPGGDLWLLRQSQIGQWGSCRRQSSGL